MLRRLTDAIVCAVLLVSDILAWLIVSTFSSLDRSEPGRIASVSLSALIIVAAPALATCMVAAIARMVTRTSARVFYSWSLFVSAVAGVFSYLTAMVSSFPRNGSWPALDGLFLRSSSDRQPYSPHRWIDRWNSSNG